VQHALEDGEYPVLHLSNASFSKDAKKDGGKAYISVSMKEAGKELKNLNIAILTPDRQEMQSLDLYLNVSQNITISCTGKNEVHLSGYFEPNNSLDDGMYGQEDMDDDDEEAEEDIKGKLESASDDEEEEEKPKAKVAKVVEKPIAKKDKDVQGFEKGGDLEKSLKAAKENAKKNSKQAAKEAEVSSDDEDEEADEAIDMDMDEDDESGEDMDDLDLDAVEGSDEDLDSDDVEAESDLGKAALNKVTEFKKKQQGKPVPVAADSEDESSDEEEEDLEALMKKSKIQKAPQQEQKKAHKQESNKS
jgi:nucleophosmin 1